MLMTTNLIDKDTLKLLRIPFSIFLMPVFLFALSQAESINWQNTLLSFIILHLFIYPASNGYNSFMDQDEGSIGGLKHPPKPTKKLFYISILLDFIGLSLSFFISIPFSICLLMYILASRAYSYKGIRLKKYPYLGFITVIFSQGAFTFLIAYHAITLLSYQEIINRQLLALIACSLLLAGVYPLTQIYQHEEDYKNGDITISYKLGYRGTFAFCCFAFLTSIICFYYHFREVDLLNNFIILQLCFIPAVVYFFHWFYKVWRDSSAADFEHTMKMNLIASVCLNNCFILLLLINQQVIKFQ
ncbi:1,4-dihydroxy-2-naphthoate octaprenyltransferase [compost metagenome]